MTPPVPARYLASLVAAVLLTGSPAKAFVINTNASPETDALEAAKTAAVWSASGSVHVMQWTVFAIAMCGAVGFWFAVIMRRRAGVQ